MSGTSTSANATRSNITRTISTSITISTLETFLMHIKKRAKYQDATNLPPESLEDGKVVSIITRWGHRQHSNSKIEFRFKTFKKMMLPSAEVVPFLVDVDAGLAPPTYKTDRNWTSRLLHRVPDSEQGVCPESDDEGDYADLSNGHDCVRIIADSGNFMWNRQKQGDFAFMEQDTEDGIPDLRDNEVTAYLILDWVEEGTLSEPMDKMKNTPGSQ
jgi:hypothetical protein